MRLWVGVHLVLAKGLRECQSCDGRLSLMLSDKRTCFLFHKKPKNPLTNAGAGLDF